MIPANLSDFLQKHLNTYIKTIPNILISAQMFKTNSKMQTSDGIKMKLTSKKKLSVINKQNE